MHSKKIGLALAAAVALVIAGCTATDEPATGGGGGADVEAAEAGLAPFLEPSAFPVTEPLETLPTGARIAVLDCGSPICGLFGDLAIAPAEALGMTVTRIESGTTADGVASAFDTVVEGEFDGVFVPALAPSLWERELDELNEAGIPVVTSGISGLDPEKVVASMATSLSSTTSGGLMADWAVTQEEGATNAVFYTTPELSFSAAVNEGFVAELERLCPDCTVRTVEIPVAQFGGGGAQIVVDDLLANPDTNVAAFAVGEQAIGLPSALRAVDLEIKTILNSPDPSVLQGIKDEEFTSAIGVDLAVLTWTMIDSLARGIVGQEVGEAVHNDEIVRQLLTADVLPEDVSRGWSGYPDFPERFQALWADAE